MKDKVAAIKKAIKNVIMINNATLSFTTFP